MTKESFLQLASYSYQGASLPPPPLLYKTNNQELYGENNTITDGGVAPPTLLQTIVMVSSNLKSLRISRNSKDSREGYDRIVGSAWSAFAPAALRLILIISL